MKKRMKNRTKTGDVKDAKDESEGEEGGTGREKPTERDG